MSNIAAALANAQTQGLDRLDAQLLLLHALGTEPALAKTRRAWLLAHGDENVPAPVQMQFRNYASRRLAGEPLAYITCHKEFFGLDLHVDRRVLIGAVALAAFALGLDSGLVGRSAWETFQTYAGTTIAATIAMLYLGSVTAEIFSARPHWMQIGVRVIGSWIAAISILVLALTFAAPSTRADKPRASTDDGGSVGSLTPV